jgi:hypothetical protein
MAYVTDGYDDMVRRGACQAEVRDSRLAELEDVRQKALEKGSRSRNTHKKYVQMTLLVIGAQTLHDTISSIERRTDIVPPQYSAGRGPAPQYSGNEAENVP